MKKYVCAICGYIYDEEKEGVKFEDLPSSWVCPLCGASKTEFHEKKSSVEPTQPKNAPEPSLIKKSDTELTNAELTALCTNLAKGCEKQYMAQEASLFNEIATYYKAHSSNVKESDYADIEKRLNADILTNYPNGFLLAKQDDDRGALRILTWSEKVSKIVASLISRYKKEGVAFLQNTKIFVCEICGFIYIGDEAPDICPICKVPKFKIHEVGRV